MWVAIAFLAGCVLAGGLAWLIGRRMMVPTNGRTPDEAEAQIHNKAKSERDNLPKPSLAIVHAMADKELEDAANDRTPLVPPRK